MVLANNITYFRVAKNISQEKLAELLSTNVVYASEIENGKRNTGIDYIEKLASIFDIPANELLVPRTTVTNKRVKRSKNIN